MTTPLSLSDRGKRLIAELVSESRELESIEDEYLAGGLSRAERNAARKRFDVIRHELSQYVAELEHCGGTK